jgi:hypothetical protein
MEIAALIVVRAETSAGVEWELQQVLAPSFRRKAAVLLIDDDAKPLAKSRYAAFREAALSWGCSLIPEAGWNSWFLWFNEADQPELIEATSVRDAKGGIGFAGLELARARGWPFRLSEAYISFEYIALRWAPVLLLGWLWLIFS